MMTACLRIPYHRFGICHTPAPPAEPVAQDVSMPHAAPPTPPCVRSSNFLLAPPPATSPAPASSN
eukprot:9569247-Karenia_brevis.AAC.1